MGETSEPCGFYCSYGYKAWTDWRHPQAVNVADDLKSLAGQRTWLGDDHL